MRSHQKTIQKKFFSKKKKFNKKKFFSQKKKISKKIFFRLENSIFGEIVRFKMRWIPEDTYFEKKKETKLLQTKKSLKKTRK